MIQHVPVLYEEVLNGMKIRPSGRYIDVTFGAGGHARGILEKLDSDGKLMAFDQDEDVWGGLIDDERFLFAPANFKYLEHYMDYYGWETADGVLADFGVSSHHLDQDYRGFSYRGDGPLDMRMNRKSVRSAADVLEMSSLQELVRMFSEYGEVRNAKTLANRIVEVRSVRRLSTTGQLVEIAESVRRGSREKYLAQVFQAIRIEVNDELGVIRDFLRSATERLASGGVLAVISFHSLEDRLVKRWMKNGNFETAAETDEFGRSKVPFERGSGKLIEATVEELDRNSRARSAKLRIGVKK